MDTLRDLLETAAHNYPSNIAFTLKLEKDHYRDITYRRFHEEIRALGEALLHRGHGEDRIAVIGKNSYPWFLINAATVYMGGVFVPLDKELKDEEFLSCLIRSEVRVLFYDVKEKAMVERALATGKTSVVQAVALYEGTDELSIGDLIEEGRELLEQEKLITPMIDRVVIHPEALSYLIFTSGTTSQSKIVMLSQKNLKSNTNGLLSVITLEEDDTNIALLPYHHTFGLTGQWFMFVCGCRTVFCDGLKHVQANFKEYGVSLFIGVPLLIETMYKKILRTAEKEGQAGRLRAASKICRGLNKLHINLNNLIFHGVREALGGKLRLVVLGAAAADPECIKGFKDFGIECIQGYGLTETSPVLSAELPGRCRPGSVGHPIGGVEMDIYEPNKEGIGEVICRGDNVMLGYYKNEEATKEVMIDGWFHTGDLGYRDKDGFYFLTGRKKNVIVLRNGKNVFPEELEVLIAPLPYVRENIVIGLPDQGNEKDLVVSLKLVYDPEFFPDKTPEEIHAEISKDIDAINATVPPYKRIKRIYTTDEEMEKTSTGKVRRFKEREYILADEAAKAALKDKEDAQDR